MKLKHLVKKIYRRTICLLKGHQWHVKQNLAASHTELSCPRCKRLQMVPMYQRPLEGIDTNTALNEESGLYEFTVVENNLPILVINYSRAELIRQGQVWTKLVNKSGKRVKLKQKPPRNNEEQNHEQQPEAAN